MINIAWFVSGAICCLIPALIIGRILIRVNKATQESKASSEVKILQERCLNAEGDGNQLRTELQRIQKELAETSNKAASFQSVAQGGEHRIEELKSEVAKKEQKIDELSGTLSKLQSSLAELSMQLESERKHTTEKLQLLSEAKDQLKIEFQNVANGIFEEKTKNFSEQSKTNLDLLLNPLREQIGDFKKKVEDVYVNESKDRQSLFEQIKMLASLNQKVSKDADNLAKALKGENKTQGNWGEMILERALELSGLKKGVEYETQVAMKDEEGQRQLPDVIVHLPEGRDIIIDSKVTLTAFERATSAETEEVQNESFAAHLLATKNHIDQLSGKSYSKLLNINTLDYVLMFMPIEAAFVAAIRLDPNLFEYAYKKQIIIVSPSTLMVTLRTVQNLWQSENQNRNSQEIAKKAADLYDKFVGFIENLEDVKKAIDNASTKCSLAINQFSVGKANIIKRLEDFKSMGVVPKKSIPVPLVEVSELEQAN